MPYRVGFFIFEEFLHACIQVFSPGGPAFGFWILGYKNKQAMVLFFLGYWKTTTTLTYPHHSCWAQ
jgi:hypothetical protein